jgi:hypothetical protein
MPLPKIDMPIYEMKVPSDGKTVKFRPFTVKEEKILLIAQESKDPSQIMLAIKQILNNCLIDRDVSSLAIFDIEFFLVQLRSKSVDNNVFFEISDPDTEERVRLELDLASIEVKTSPNHTNKIKVSDEYFLFMKYPTLDQFEKLVSSDKQTVDYSYDVMLSCLDKLASDEEVYGFKDFSKKEVEDFVESLPSDIIKSIKQFFDTMPHIRHEIEYKNRNGDIKTFVIEGTQSFFI